MPIDPSPAEMRRLGYAVVDRVVDHLAELGDRRVATPAIPSELRELVAEPLPRSGQGTEDTLERFFDQILPRATLVNHPRFFAYIPGPGSYIGALGEFCAAATNLFVGTWLGGASMAQLESQTLGWLREAIGLGVEYDGVLTSGGSMANLGALAAARARARSRGIDPRNARIYIGAEAHYSVAKSAAVLGFDTEQCVRVPVDRDQRIDQAALRASLERDAAAGHPPLLLCATAGTTSTGATDPIDECAAICAERGMWLHVDGAYCAALALLDESTSLRRQLARADSITLDPHKWLYCPFECGTLLTRDIASLQAAFGGDANYMQDVPKDELNYFLRGPELSRGNRALKLWTLLRSVGIDAIAARIREDCRLAALAEELLAADPRVRIVTPTAMSVFSFAVDGGADAGTLLVQRLIEDGTTMLSSTRIHDEFVLRFCVANHRTTEEDVRRGVARVLELLD